MLWDKRLTQLNDALALLVPFPNNILVFLQNAQIDYTQINLMGDPLSIWNSALRFAVGNNQVSAIVEAVLDKYPNNPYLLAFKENVIQDYSSGPDINSLTWKKSIDEDTKEKIMGAESSLLPIKFLEQGLLAARCVVRIKIPRYGKNELGSGFLVDNNLLITNHHVIKDLESARLAEIAFDYEAGLNGLAIEPSIFSLAPDEYFHADAEDDFAIIKVAGDVNAVYGKLEIKDTPVKTGDFVNIIQHPGGRYKQIAMYNNVVTYTNNRIVQYLTDTEPGSSGSPVFNSNWEVVAVHHSGGMLIEPGLSQKMLRNEGIAINRIHSALSK